MTTTAPTVRHRQKLAAATLARLLSVPAPECCAWRITLDDDADIHGQLPPGSLDAIRLRLHQWAAVLDDGAQWRYEQYKHERDRARVDLTGTYLGMRVQIWDGVPYDPAITVGDLAAPPQLDVSTSEGLTVDQLAARATQAAAAAAIAQRGDGRD
jgi:hypothetical protein